MVDRYNSECTELCHFPDDKGKWVYYDDYEALEAKLAALESELAIAKAGIEAMTGRIK